MRIQIARAIGPEHPFEPLAHLAGGLVRERDREDLVRLHALRRQQVRDAVGEDARLAGAGAGDDEERPFGREDGLALGGIQVCEVALGRGDRHAPMLATEAEVPPERGEAGETRRRFEDPADQAVDRVALDDAGEPDRRSDGERDRSGEAPRFATCEAEVVEDIACRAGELRPEARRPSGRDGGSEEQQPGDARGRVRRASSTSRRARVRTRRRRARARPSSRRRHRERRACGGAGSSARPSASRGRDGGGRGRARARRRRTRPAERRPSPRERPCRAQARTSPTAGSRTPEHTNAAA